MTFPESDQMSRELLLEAVLPAPLDVQHVEVRRIRMAAGFAPGSHVHNGPVFGSVVEGSVRFQRDGAEEVVLRPGDVFYEPAGERIPHFDALDEGATFLAYYPLGAGQVPEVEMG